MYIKKIFLFIAGLISIILFAAPIIEISNNKSTDELIEVCDNGIVYVPQGTVLVKCHGVIKKVLKIESASSERMDCNCPTCCNRICYIWISCEPLSNHSNEFDHGDIDRNESRTRIDYCRLWTTC